MRPASVGTMQCASVFLAASCACAVIGAEQSAAAQGSAKATKAYLRESEQAPHRALEITLGTGYAQGFGQLKKGSANDIGAVASGGMGFNLGVGYRISPRLGVAAALHYQELNVGGADAGVTGARGLLAGFDATLHLDPYRRLAPWVRAGCGYRLFWQTSNGPTTLYHGFDFLRLATGLDLRGSADVSMGPIVGADVDVFIWERLTGTTNSVISDPRVSVFVYAGLQGRFDLFGTRAWD